MSEVYEVAPPACPSCGASWTTPGSHRPGWDNGLLTGGYGGRTWECQTCGHTELPEKVELRKR